MSLEILHNAITNANLQDIEKMLKQGIDASAIFESSKSSEAYYHSTLAVLPSLDIEEKRKLQIAKLLLSYNAHSAILGQLTKNPMSEAIIHEEWSLVRLFLENGFDSSEINCTALLANNTNIPSKLLEDIKNNPFVKIENKKYILSQKDARGFTILGNFKKNDVTFLYTDIALVIFTYWCAKNNLLTKSISQSFYKLQQDEFLAKHLSYMEQMHGILGNNFTTEHIKTPDNIDIDENEEMYFIEEYLSLTNWKYNFHDDLVKLFSFNNKIVILKNNTKVFTQVLKLLDMRYKLYKKYWVYSLNSNQNKAELQALIEGKEPPKREVDLSWLEEHCGEDDMSDNSVEIEKSENNNTNKDNIIPDDFFIKK